MVYNARPRTAAPGVPAGGPAFIFEEADRVISTNQFRAGMTIRFEGDIYRIVDFQHVKPGKGGAFVRTKLRNVATGRVVDKTFRPEQKFDQVRTESRTMTYLYDEPDQVVLHGRSSRTSSWPCPRARLEDRLDLMKDNMEVEVLYMDDEPFDVELPVFVDLEVTETAPGVRGDTVSGGSKSATLETGATVQVPLFIESGRRHPHRHPHPGVQHPGLARADPSPRRKGRR